MTKTTTPRPRRPDGPGSCGRPRRDGRPGSGRRAQAAARPTRLLFAIRLARLDLANRDTLYLKVRSKDVYRLDLAYGSSQLQWPGSHLVTVVRGSDRICAPIDLDLRVSDGYSMSIPIRAKTITKMTPEEIEAIPKKYRP